MTVDWAAKIADVCRHPLRLNIEPTDWAHDVVTWRQRAEQAETAVQEVRRLQEMTIASSCRVGAIEQAEDTLAALDRIIHIWA